MLRIRSMQGVFWTTALLLAIVPTAWGQSAAQADFQRGYYLQTHERDLEGAIAAYERVAGDRDAPELLRTEARTRLAQSREDLAAVDFARLMPPDVLAYAEFSSPGEHIARLAQQMGLVRAPGVAAEAKPGVTPLGDGVFFPDDFSISPALLNALKAVRGAAAAVTGIDDHDMPEGLLVVHPGDADLIRGLLESAVQFAEPADPIRGYKTYALQGQAWATVTARLFLVARKREALVDAVARLQDPKAANLANNAGLKSARPERDGAMIFIYVDGPRAAQEFRRRVHGDEAAIAAGVLDLDHLKAISAFVRASNEGLEVQARLDLKAGHRNLAYALIRTAPCERTALEYVPGGAAAVALLGLNPARPVGADRERPGGTADFVTAMDIGREFFANLQEAAVFVTPRAAEGQTAGPPIPEVGMVLVARDVDRSEALWSQLLALPALFLPPPAGGVSQVTIEGTQATEYRYPNAPPIVLARVKDRAVVIGTHGAVKSAVGCATNGNVITRDSGFKPLLARLTPSTSKAILVHVGRAAETAAGVARGREAEHLKLAASILRELRVAVVTDEQPMQFTLRAEATGLPNIPDAIRKFAAARHPARATQSISKAPPYAVELPRSEAEHR